MTDNDRPSVFFGLSRLGLGLIFLWAFFDKLFGLGRATTAGQAWLNGGSPTSGFLLHATTGPLANFYHGLAGNSVVDWLFMLGLLGIGLALTLGVKVKLASYAGVVLMVLLWSSVLPPANHPFLDEHIIYALVLLGIAQTNAGDVIGFGRWWSKTRLVEKYPILR
jgi:thiosulfate dehydrogenase [quinone] large subunit